MGPAVMRVASGTSALDRCTFEFMDLKTLDRVDVSWSQKGRHPHSSYRDFNMIRASAEGLDFSIAGVGPVSLNGDQVNYSFRHDHRGLMTPSYDGSYFLSHNQIFNRKMKAMGPTTRTQGQFLVPAVAGNYYLRYSGVDAYRDNQKNASVSAKLFMFGESRPLFTIPEMEPPRPKSSGNYRSMLTPDKRVMFVPQANVVVTLGTTDDYLVMRRLDIDEALEESGIDYLIVMSAPPGKAEPGENYQYQLVVKSKKGGVKYKLEAGPEGMAISDKGLISWQVPKDLNLVENKVIVTVSDSVEQEVFHTFTVNVPQVALRLSLIHI